MFACYPLLLAWSAYLLNDANSSVCRSCNFCSCIVISVHSATYDAQMDIRIYPDFVAGYPDVRIKLFDIPSFDRTIVHLID